MKRGKLAEADGLTKISISDVGSKLQQPRTGEALRDDTILIKSDDIFVIVNENREYVEIWHRDTKEDGSIATVRNKVSLATSLCYYGGTRLWFLCPHLKDGMPCARRIGVLYKIGEHFACRHCFHLTYRSRNVSGINKRFGIIDGPEIGRLTHDKRIGRFYRGRPTKRTIRFLEKFNKLEAYTRLISELRQRKFDKKIRAFNKKISRMTRRTAIPRNNAI